PVLVTSKVTTRRQSYLNPNDPGTEAAWGIARNAAFSQFKDNRLVPMVEPEILFDGGIMGLT
ncbi:hypothetical protein D0Y65_029256, partial [Glycine soja]